MSTSERRREVANQISGDMLGRTVSIKGRTGTDYYGEAVYAAANECVVLILQSGSVATVYLSDIESITFPFASLTDAEKEIMRDDSF